MNLTEKMIKRQNDIIKYHNLYPTHGYRWLNAKIALDENIFFSDNYAQRVCSYAGLRSVSKRFRRYKTTDKFKIYPNLLLADLNINSPLQVVVSDMTAFRAKDVFYELTLYMDLYNNEIVSYALSEKRGDRNTYYDGLKEFIKKKEGNLSLKTIFTQIKAQFTLPKNLMSYHHSITLYTQCLELVHQQIMEI